MWEGVGGLIDFAVLGAADHRMAWAMLGYGIESVHGGMCQQYKDMVKILQEHTLEYIKNNIKHVDALIAHYCQGNEAHRKYWDQWDILEKSGFNPAVDLKRDWQNLWQLTGHNHAPRDGVRAYFQQRDEDAPYTAS